MRVQNPLETIAGIPGNTLGTLLDVGPALHGIITGRSTTGDLEGQWLRLRGVADILQAFRVVATGVCLTLLTGAALSGVPVGDQLAFAWDHLFAFSQTAMGSDALTQSLFAYKTIYALEGTAAALAYVVRAGEGKVLRNDVFFPTWIPDRPRLPTRGIVPKIVLDS